MVSKPKSPTKRKRAKSKFITLIITACICIFLISLIWEAEIIALGASDIEPEPTIPDFQFTASDLPPQFTNSEMLPNFPTLILHKDGEMKLNFHSLAEDDITLQRAVSNKKKLSECNLQNETVKVRALETGRATVDLAFKVGEDRVRRTMNVEVQSPFEYFPHHFISKITVPFNSPAVSVDFSPFVCTSIRIEHLPNRALEATHTKHKVKFSFLPYLGVTKVYVDLENTISEIYTYTMFVKTSDPAELPVGKEIQKVIDDLDAEAKEVSKKIKDMKSKVESQMEPFEKFAKDENQNKLPPTLSLKPEEIEMKDMENLLPKEQESCSAETPSTVFYHKHRRWNLTHFGNMTAGTPSNRFRMHRIGFDVSHLKRPYYPYHGVMFFCENFEIAARNAEKNKFKGFKGAVDFGRQCFQSDWKKSKAKKDPAQEISVEELHYYLEDAYDEELGQVYMISGRDVVVKEGTLWSCKEQLFQSDICSHEAQARQLWKKPNMKDIPVVDKLFVIAQNKGYGHFVLEQLPRLAFFLPFLRKNKEVDICVGVEDSPARDWLVFLGIRKDRIKYCVDNSIRAKEVWIPEVTPCQIPLRWTTAQLNHDARQRAAAKYKLVDYPKRHILLTKRVHPNTVRRHIDKWDQLLKEMKKRLKKETIITLDDSKLRPDDWIPKYANAKMVVSVYGAGLANTVVCAPGTVVIQVGVANYGPEYFRQSSVLGHRFFGYVTPHKWNLTVDPGEVVDIMNWYLGADKADKKEKKSSFWGF